MQLLSQLIRRILFAQAVAVGLLLLAGWVLKLVEADVHANSFFTYRLRSLEGFPYWFASALCLFVMDVDHDQREHGQAGEG